MSEFVKKPNLQVEYTPQLLQELKRCAQDPAYFINTYCYIQNQELGCVKFTLRDYQRRIIGSLHQNNFSILLISRQSGKTETAAAYAYWFAIFHPDKNVLIASNKRKGASDIMKRVKYMYERTPDFLRPGTLYYPRESIDFDNGSSIFVEATTEDTGRGKAIALFILDELAHVRKNVQEELWSSILPTISSGNLSCIIMSTPNGDTDLYAELWRSATAGTNDFVPVYVDISEVPGRDEAWQKKWRAKLGDSKFEQNFLCEFLSSDPILIKSQVLLRLKGDEPIDTDRGFRFWKELNPYKTYVIGADVAEGVEQDFSTIEVLELDSLEQVAEFRSNKINESQLYDALKWIIKKILSTRDPRTRKRPTLYWSFENNSAGAAIGMLFYNDVEFPEEAELISERGKRRPGMRTVNVSKMEACRSLKNLIEKPKNGLTLHSSMLIYELKNYVSTGASFAAKKGATDDLVSAMLIATRVIKNLAEFEPGVFEKLYRSEGDFHPEGEVEHDPYDEPAPFIMS